MWDVILHMDPHKAPPFYSISGNYFKYKYAEYIKSECASLQSQQTTPYIYLHRMKISVSPMLFKGEPRKKKFKKI